MAANSDVINKALVHLGVTERISDIEDTSSNEAVAIKRIYEDALKEMMRETDWFFLRKYQALAELVTVPTTEFEHAYSRPADCLKARRIVSGQLPDSEKTRIKFEEAHSDLGPVILTNQPDAVLEFTVYDDDPTHWDPLFLRAFALKVAMLAAPAVTKGDPFQMQDKLEVQYTKALIKARTAQYRERKAGPRPDSPQIQERN
jgi:hypothetical protein